MLSLHLRKFSALFANYGLGAVKNVWLLTSLLPIARTVNLNKLKDHIGSALGNSDVSPSSHYRRLTRFFKDWGNNQELRHDLMRQNLLLLKKLGHKTLVIDGTSWKIGETCVHYLVVSILVGKVAVPLYWTQLGKIGASSQCERKEMFEKALSLFDLKGMSLLADREYIGKEWFNYLKANKINFVIRMRMGDYESDVDATKGKSYQQMLARCASKGKSLQRNITLDAQSYTMVMMKNPKHSSPEPVFIFLTTLSDAKKAADIYAKRWKIECLFKHLKTNGYNLEDLNLKDTGKTLLMFTIVATAYVLAIREGICRKAKIPTNRYADGSQWPQTSLFREGLAILTSKCHQFIDFLKYVFKAMATKNHAIFKNVQ